MDDRGNVRDFDELERRGDEEGEWCSVRSARGDAYGLDGDDPEACAGEEGGTRGRLGCDRSRAAGTLGSG